MANFHVLGELDHPLEEVEWFSIIFKSPAYFWLTVFGLVTISFASRGNQLKGLAGGCIGVLLSLIGYSTVFAVERHTFGSYYLWDGVQLVPLVIGLFAISEIIMYSSKGGSISQVSRFVSLEKSIVRKQVKQGIKPKFPGLLGQKSREC